MNHQEYLKSKEWQDIRDVRLKVDRYTCQGCGRHNELNVHHVTYERLGYERIEDLITLCKRCHADTHYFDRPEADEKMLLQATEYTEQEYESRKILLPL